ncbi:hypothetical protein SAMN05192563_102832 [Paraburkholderia aspalathi]|uniref:Uncharacterized protein n=1 Tax=Paraburkholderia aspalathi TaxID=1324617 RepID=A0A1I7EKZ6_9BURK|nr:hypothetical protein SAMN05192563_102832 [Paraburkholderia aspalathi]
MDVPALRPFRSVCGGHQECVYSVVDCLLLGADEVKLSKVRLVEQKFGLNVCLRRWRCIGRKYGVTAVELSDCRDILRMKLVATDYCRMSFLNPGENRCTNPSC